MVISSVDKMKLIEETFDTIGKLPTLPGIAVKILEAVKKDYFKRVNDTYGHLAGDHALKEVSRFLQDHMRSSDIVARYGG